MDSIHLHVYGKNAENLYFGHTYQTYDHSFAWTDGRTDEGQKVTTIAHPEHSSSELNMSSPFYRKKIRRKKNKLCHMKRCLQLSPKPASKTTQGEKPFAVCTSLFSSNYSVIGYKRPYQTALMCRQIWT